MKTQRSQKNRKSPRSKALGERDWLAMTAMGMGWGYMEVEGCVYNSSGQFGFPCHAQRHGARTEIEIQASSLQVQLPPTQIPLSVGCHGQSDAF